MIVLKTGTVWFYNAVMHPNDADGMANGVDPDQKEQSDYGSALFAPTFLSQYSELSYIYLLLHDGVVCVLL